MGETFNATLTNGLTLSQGEQQPEIELLTSSLGITACPGAAVTVPFTTTGYMDTANIFTAQLSNAAGSFASPVSIGTLIGIASGSIVATIPAITPAGSGYRIRVLSSNPVYIGTDNGANIDGNCNLTLQLSAYIEGFYRGNNLMAAVVDPINYPLRCDTIVVELHNAISPYNLIQSMKGVLSTSGICNVLFPNQIIGNSYYVVIRHRNGLQTWSNATVNFNSNSISYSFTNAASKAFGNNMRNLNDGNFAIYSGDVNQDGFINSADYTAVENGSQSFLFGYIPNDLTGDGLVESSDYSLIENNSKLLLIVAAP